MKKLTNIFTKGLLALTLILTSANVSNAQEKEVTGWGDFKLFLDPGHSGHENQGLWGYSEAEKVLSIALTTREYLLNYTDIPESCLKLCRTTEQEQVGLSERTDAANAWGADFYYSIHSDAGGNSNTTLFLFGGWKNNGEYIEKTPNGGKKYAEILNNNLPGVMQVQSRGVWYDRVFYNGDTDTHSNQYPYLHVNRESNMASMLSEGGFHTIAVQQQKNMNAEYKRLEAFAAFQTILEYRGLTKPAQTFLTGIVRNSENNVPIDGATVKVGDKTYTTDTYESLFKKYTKNPDLIHNGFYLFENLTPGEYTVEFSAPGYESTSKTVTVKSEPTKTSAESVTFCDVTMTSTSPAKVSSISVDDPSGVDMSEDIIITFSRQMDKESVERAFSINNEGEVFLEWDNDYTLRVKIGYLWEECEYTITIDGNIAKNQQTQQKFDGDGDGVEGGNYTFTFTTLPPDTEAPFVASSTPNPEEFVTYTYRPVIRIEFNEPIIWNEDKYINSVSVTDKEGNSYDGVLKHELIREKSVLHYYLKKDLPLDKAFLVFVKGGFADKAGNLSHDYAFRFLSEYRPTKDETVVDPLDDNSIGAWFTPGGSGSSKGLTEQGNTGSTTSETSSLDRTTCFKQKYSFDPYFSEAYWQIRWYDRKGATCEDTNGVLRVMLHGDGSNNTFGFCVRANPMGGGVKVQNTKPINFRGWKTMAWEIGNGDYWDLSNTDKLNGSWKFDALFLKHENIMEGDEIENPETGEWEQIPIQAWEGELKYDQLVYTHYDNTVTRKASLDDIDMSSVDEVVTNDIAIVTEGNQIKVVSESEILNVAVFNAAGQLIQNIAPASTVAVINADDVTNGVLIVKVTTTNSVKTQKVIF